MMTDTEAIASVRAGGRATTTHSLYAAESEDSGRCVHAWRTIACDSETDVIECSKCGMQRACRCDFDDEYA